MKSEPEESYPNRHDGRLTGRRIVVAVTGGIAAYKTCSLVRDLIREGAEVQVLMSRAAKEFVTPLTFSTLTGKPVLSDMFPPEPPTNPIHLLPGHWGEILVVAPATADFIGKLAHGLADDIPSTAAIAFSGTVLLAPAMNPNMWLSKAVQANMALLKERGIAIVGPDSGEMGGVQERSGPGRMSEPEAIRDRLEYLLYKNKNLSGRKILVTSGPTREKLDPVRFISNFSSGRMGDAIARAAYLKGADVTLIRGKGATGQKSTDVEIVEVDSAFEMAEAVKSRFTETDMLIMAAAVADWTPAERSVDKIKKVSGDLKIKWKQTEDILSWAGESKTNQVVVGFALETKDHLSGAGKKLIEKKADVIVLNDPTRKDSEFGGDTTRLTLLSRNDKPVEYELLSKQAAAERVLDFASKFLK